MTKTEEMKIIGNLFEFQSDEHKEYLSKIDSVFNVYKEERFLYFQKIVLFCFKNDKIPDLFRFFDRFFVCGNYQMLKYQWKHWDIVDAFEAFLQTIVNNFKSIEELKVLEEQNLFFDDTGNMCF